MQFYLTKVRFYNDYEEKSQTNYSLRIGEGYADVAKQIGDDYRGAAGLDSIEAITIIPIGDDLTKFLDLSEDDYHKFVKEWAGIDD